ncbi:hypothetical protein [Arthrobacter sp. NEB 688]|uniref:hypothetical protein n=1 Tax=Arthrobacter sp. NEB 688 TaxID=904039 RepID=UPI001564CADD|nr:hypothetical protein [Arthrobacter sp. NEB 688]QKE84818.1 hypothetical protein HL663_13290 [Arthrobacter sp. NEB 688]
MVAGVTSMGLGVPAAVAVPVGRTGVTVSVVADAVVAPVLSLAASPGVITRGDSTVLTATLTTGDADHAPLADRTLVLEAANAAGEWVASSTGTTGADGTARFAVSPTAPTRYRTVAVGTGATVVASDALTVGVRALAALSLTGPAAADEGRTASWVVQLTTDAPPAGRTVLLEEVADGGGTRLLGSASTDARGRAVVPATVRGGPSVLRARIGTTDDLAAATSGTLSVTARYASGMVLRSPGRVVEGSVATARLTARGSRGPLVGVPVVVRRDRVPVATVTTDELGEAAVPLASNASASYDATFAGSVDQTDASSGSADVTVERPLTLVAGGPSTATLGRPARFTARLTRTSSGEPVPGASVSLWRLLDGVWAKVTDGRTGEDGNAAFSAPVTGSAFEVRSDASVAPGDPAHPELGTVLLREQVAPVATVTVGRDTSTSLTLPDSLPSGATGRASVTVRWAGSAEAVPGLAVELQRLDGDRWLAVGTGTTDEAGTVGLDVPQRSTSSYRAVTAAGDAPPWRALGSASSSVLVRTGIASRTGVQVSSDVVRYGYTRTVTGWVRVDDPEGRLPSARLELWTSTGGSWRRVSTSTTDSSGVATWTVRPRVSTLYRVVHTGGRPVTGGSTVPSTSTAAVLQVQSVVTLRVPSTTVRATASASITGTVAPARANRTVTLWVDGTKRATTRTSSTGTYAFRHRFPSGTHRVQTSVPATTGVEGSSSALRTVRSR